METYTIADYEKMLKEAKAKKDRAYAKRLLITIDYLKKVLPHTCGGESIYMAPIVNIRCAKCNQPL